MDKLEKLTDFQRNLLDGIKEHANGHSKNCIFNAIEHLKIAYKIKDIDSSMALFRAITAEEEAASAIFIILKEHNYQNANKIRFKDHKYKQGLSLFIGAIQDFFYKESLSNSFPFENNITLEFEPKSMILQLGIPLKEIGQTMYPIPPLNFEMTLNQNKYYFQKELLEFTSKNDFKSIIKMIEDKANFRNRLIYADNQGWLNIKEGTETEIDKYYDTVFKLVIVYSLIYPYKDKKSDFIQNCINGFIFMMMEIET